MLKLDSKTGLVNGNPEVVYNYISDFRNFAHLLPAERLHDLVITSDSLQFGIDGIGTVGLIISEKKPFNQLVITATRESSADFTFWFNIAGFSDGKAQVNLALQASLNMFLEMMAKGPLQQFIDLIIDKLTQLEFNK